MHTLGPEQLANVPGGENAPFQQVLLRLPGVVEDTFGQKHVRGEHANLTYRINGVLLPQPINGLRAGDRHPHRHSVTLIDGTLPAQFGLHTAGIVDVTTKSGPPSITTSFRSTAAATTPIQPSFQLGGASASFDYFVTGSYNHNGLGIENPTSSHRALHDYTDQEHFFGYLSYRLDDTSRLSLITNNYYGDFEIPDTPGCPGVTPGRRSRPPIPPTPMRARTSRNITMSWPTRRPSTSFPTRFPASSGTGRSPSIPTPSTT